MTDFEMLKLAARACGYQVFSEQHGELVITDSEGRNLHWNPLIDSKDAFDLKVYLRITVDYITLPHAEYVRAYNGQVPAALELLWSLIGVDEIDTNAAERRVVTRYAAEIGKTLKERN